MAKLVIVESPAKAKTIGKYLGDDYEVTASMGHIRDRRGAPEWFHPDDGACAQDLSQARKIISEAPYFTALFDPKGWNKA